MPRKFELVTFLNYLDQRLPIRDLNDFDVENCLDEQSQNVLLQHIKKITPYNPFYVKNFLKFYISIIESSKEELLDDFYILACDGVILNAKENKPTDLDLLAYYTGGNEKETTQNYQGKILTWESPRLLLDQGSTGQRTWDASLYLANFLNSNGFNLHEKRVCELGAGTGVVSLSLSKFYKKHGHIKEIVATDGDVNFLQRFQEILSFNHSPSDVPIQKKSLAWGTTSLNDVFDTPSEVDVIVASDVTYDSAILSPLCSTILHFFSRGCSNAIIASTIRKVSTMYDFHREMDKHFKENWRIIDRCEKPSDLKYKCCFKAQAPEMQIYQIDNNRLISNSTT